MKGLRVAIVGATGLVGQEFIKILQQRHFPVDHLELLASDRSAGRKLNYNGRQIEVRETTPDSFEDIDLSLFSAGADISRHFSPIAAKKGAVVIDNSAAFRMDNGVPLVVPEVNIEDARNHHGIIANPNCSTIQMVVVLNPLHQFNPIKRVVVSTYQAVSGTGTPAIDALSEQTRTVLEGQPVTPHVYPHQIAFNLLPEIDIFMDSGYTKEEWKMLVETRKIMHLPNLPLSATCVRVPVFIGHSEALNIEFDRPISADEARNILAKAPGVRVLDDPTVSLYPHPWMAAGTDETWVGRIRQDCSHPKGLTMWVVADNVRKGAALNAVQIAEEMRLRGWLGGK
ncbi:MAG: aspartate-semialdehyde dehydrogenase [Dehalogenimonas sp.]|uniref:Aspartate-semialdehyde dehydrogenase n=1 Tax=Candidatus Dehalogenimonas loeffleri TaxID=3127115 RepID=A0ABZ2J741_9CHLR|nr:aspartate-semialdehyde dehydrogenase [Dehalogenimonas sp.]